MNSFHSNKAYEDVVTRKLLAAVAPACAEMGATCEPITDLEEQLDIGDLRLSTRRGKVITIDIKAERTARPNVFFETWSNFSLDGRPRIGWGVRLQSDRLWYYFDEIEGFAVIDFPRLKAWLGSSRGDGRRQVDRYREVPQTAHAQKNHTRGLLIPFRDLPAEVFPHAYLIRDGVARECTRQDFVRRVSPPERA